MADGERVDSTTIDEEHRNLQERDGYAFILNEFDDPEDIEEGKKFAKKHGWGELVVSETAYDLFGQPLSRCVSVWGKRAR